MMMNLYNVVFRSNVTYIAYVVIGATVLEVVYGGFTETLWRTANSGKLYDQIDWSKYESIYLEGDDDDEDDDDDE